MRKIQSSFLILCIITATAYIIAGPLQGTAFIEPMSSSYVIGMKQDILCLMMAYPGHISNAVQSDGQVYIEMKSGKKILYDDKKTKSMESKIAYPDLQDMMEQTYPITPIKSLMNENYDPGRARVYSLLREVYGSSKQQIEDNLVAVKAGGRTFEFNRRNQAAEALENVMKELATLAEKSRGTRAFAYSCVGTYNYRVIAGTNRLSAHAYGIAIDLCRDKRDYWKWASREEGEERISTYPVKIVELFEKNNFIWGGKWGHFDILHFEYRPEIIIKARYFGNTQGFRKAWYEGVPLDDAYIRDCIKKIDEAIR